MGALTWKFNRASLQKLADKVVLAPVFAELVKRFQHAKQRQGKGTAREVEATEAELASLGTRYTEFMQKTSFNPFQGMGYQFGCVIPAVFSCALAMRGVAMHPDSFRSFVTAPTLWL